MGAVQRMSAIRRIEILFNEIRKAIPKVSENEAAMLLPHMNELIEELGRRTRRPKPFREAWKPLAEDLGLTTRSLREYPPAAQLAQLCRQEIISKTLQTGGAYPVVGCFQGRPVLIVCYPFYAPSDGVRAIDHEVIHRHGTGLNPFGSTIYGEFEGSEVREALSSNLQFFAKV